VDGSLAGQVVRQGEPVLLNDPALFQRAQVYQWPTDLSALLAVPLHVNGGVIGVLVGSLILDFGIGGTTLVGVLGASASYIAVPPAMRLAIPEANPSFYLTLSLGVTFPFNVVIGIPLYYWLAQMLAGGA
jgi:hypothetical protein